MAAERANAEPTPQFLIATGTGPGGGPHVKVFTTNGAERASFFAFDPNFRGGVNVAVGDLDGDGFMEIIAGAGPGGGSHVRIFTEDGEAIDEYAFFAFHPAFKGGVNLGVADVDGDADDEILVAPASGGGPHVKVIEVTEEGLSLEKEFFAFDQKFLGGVSVAGLYVDPSNNEGIVVGAGPGGGPHVKTFNAALAELGSWFAYDAGYLGGVSVSGWFANDDEVEEVVTGSLAGPGHIRSWNVAGSLAGGVNFFAFPTTDRGANIATIDPESGGPILIAPNRGAGNTFGRDPELRLTGPQLNPYPGFPGGIKIATAYGLYDSGPAPTTTTASTTTTSTSTTTTSTSTTSTTVAPTTTTEAT